MKAQKLTSISFKSYLKLIMTIFLGVGLLGSVFSILGMIIGFEMYLNFNETVITGIKAGLINFFFFPLLAIFMGFIVGIITFLPFKGTLNIIKGINLNIELK